MDRLKKGLLILVGFVSLGLGLAGVVLPVLPTTPFILLSLFCFGKSSERLHDWLISHPRVGPEIHAWRDYGAISKKAKISAVTLMAAGMIFSIVVGLKPIVLIVQGVIISSVALFLITRPMPPKSDS